MAEYGLLFLLLLRALGPSRPAAAAVIAVMYAVTDEWHQSFVSGRVGSPVDVAIDALGVAVAYGVWRRLGAHGARRRPGRRGATAGRSPES
jgi:VanZ family protein